MARKFFSQPDGTDIEPYPFDGALDEHTAAELVALLPITSGVEIENAGTPVVDGPFTVLNFAPTGTLSNVSMASAGGGTVNLTIGLNLSSANTWLADQSVPDEAYGAGWNGSMEVPTKNAVYDKIETLSSFTTEDAQDAVGAMVDASLVYADATPLLQRAALTGDVTASAGSNSTTIANDAVTFAKMQNATQACFIGATGAGDFAERTYANTRSDLGLVIGTNVQAWDTQLDSLAAIAYTGNANKYVRVNGAENAFEVVALAGGGDMLAANNLSDVASAATAFGNIKQAASDTATGVIEIAIQSEMETGTDTTRAVTPGRQHFHPSAAKCWVASTQSSTTIQEAYNVASVADTGAGVSTVTIANDFAGTTYCPVVGAEHNSASGTTQTYNIDNGGRAAETYVIQSWQTDGTEVLTDPSASWFSVCYGDLP